MLKLWSYLRFFNQRLSTKVESAKGQMPVKSVRADAKQLPYIEIETSANHHKSFTAPNPDIKATVYSSDRTAVGHVTYAVSPLFDKLYIFNITIQDANRRQGFGLAVMAYLATTYRLPITTIKEVFSASGFWRAARLASSVPIETLSISEMDAERERWAHLKPLMGQLDILISDRFSNRESWETAVGRGLPDWPASTPDGRLFARRS